MARAKADIRLTISMPAADPGRLVKIQKKVEAVSASEAIRYALRVCEKHLEAEEAEGEEEGETMRVGRRHRRVLL